MVAATFVSYVGHEAEYVYGGFHLDAAPLHPNHVLHHRGIEEAIARGKRGYDLGMLGGTERSAGVDAFKRSFGAEAVSLHDTLHWELRPHLARAMAAVRSQTWGKRAVNALRRVAVRRFDATSGAETAP
jgi:lipid II:glycine glycyltransferase (peptidoglycan interpeptide bridge formation enzyme)